MGSCASLAIACLLLAGCDDAPRAKRPLHGDPPPASELSDEAWVELGGQRLALDLLPIASVGEGLARLELARVRGVDDRVAAAFVSETSARFEYRTADARFRCVLVFADEAGVLRECVETFGEPRETHSTSTGASRVALVLAPEWAERARAEIGRRPTWGALLFTEESHR